MLNSTWIFLFQVFCSRWSKRRRRREKKWIIPTWSAAEQPLMIITQVEVRSARRTEHCQINQMIRSDKQYSVITAQMNQARLVWWSKARKKEEKFKLRGDEMRWDREGESLLQVSSKNLSKFFSPFQTPWSTLPKGIVTYQSICSTVK